MELQFPSSARLVAIQKIGTGGDGEVWIAEHEHLGRVAVKIALQNNIESKASFITEYTLLRSLKHPALLSLYDFGCLADGRPFIVMELCAEGYLYEVCGGVDLSTRLNLFSIVLTGFEYLHNVGLIHRDVKGENILIARDGTPRISDLGLAVASGSANKGRSGTLEYMAPEVIQNEGSSAASDVYSLGVTLYRLITNSLPFVGTDPIQIVAAKQDLESVGWEGVRKAISERTVEFIKKCLHPDPRERTPGARAILDHLLGERLVDPAFMQTPDIGNYVHYHYRSFNYSFCKQELRQLSGSIYIVDHLQDPESGLFAAIVDYLKTQLCQVSVDSEQRAIKFQTSGGKSGRVELQQDLSGSFVQSESVTYHELGQTSLNGLTEKILRCRTLPRYRAVLHEYTSGNLALLSLLLQSLQDQRYLDTRRLRLGLPAGEIDQFSPGPKYWEKLAQLVPKLEHELQPVVAFLSCDNSGYRVEELVAANLISQSDLDALVESGVLNASNFKFRRPYLRLHFYHQLDSRQRHQYHSEWIVHLQVNARMDERSRLHYLFEHYVSAQLEEQAIAAAEKLAAGFSQQQDNEEAYEILSRVRRLSERNSSSTSNLSYLIQLADAAKKLGKIDESLHLLARVVRYASRSNDTSMLAEAYKRAGDLYKDKRHSERGLQALQKALLFYEAEGNELELSHCFNNIGNLHWIAGDLASAETDYRRALEIQRSLDVQRDIASTLSNLGTIMAVQQKLDEAIEIYEESIVIKRKLDDRLELARTLNNVARAKLEADRMEEARAHLKEALELNLELGAENELPYNYDNLYELEFRSGKYKSAFEWLMTGLRRVDRNDLSARATFICYLAEIMLAQGKYGKAGTLLSKATQLASGVTDQLLSSRLAMNLGEFFRVQRNFTSAHTWMQKSLAEAEKLRDPKAMAAMLVKLARVDLMEGVKTERVGTALDKATRLIADIPARRELTMINIVRVHWLLEHEQLDEAETILQSLKKIAEMAIFQPYQPEFLYCSAWLEFVRGDVTKAAELSCQALAAAEKLSALELKWQILLLAGEAYRELGQYESAMKAYIDSFETVRQLAEGIKGDNLKEMFLQDENKMILTDRLHEIAEVVK